MQKVMPGYYDLLRPEILKLVSTDAKIILDVGCGSGRLGAALKERQQARVAGIETDPAAAAVAQGRLDRVYKKSCQGFPVGNLEYKPDCIIFGDVLEHISNPWHTLKNFAGALAKDGTIVASIPLVDHPGVIRNLQRGIFQYRKAGILDATHLRFFTQTSIFQMFAQADMKIIHAHRHPSDQNPQQLLLTAKKLDACSGTPQATIIMLTHNGFRHTKQAITSFALNTNTCCRLVVVDNNSTDDTKDYLRAQPFIVTIENSHNLGFPAGVNTALHAIKTPYFVIANNDITFPPDWLSILLKIAEKTPDVGILGITSNNISGVQKVQAPHYDGNSELYAVARKISEENAGHIQYHPRIVFVLVLLRTELLQKIGPLDERFGLGNFEDDDYCLRSIMAGLKTAYTKSVYIHHHQAASFRENNIDYKALMRRNAKLFVEKWGQDIFYQRQKIYENLKS
jgi:GT2 family glycosyltransferase